MEIANKPLTLEQLRGIDGQPVWIKDLKTPECSGWRMIYWDRGKYLVLIAKSIQGYILEEYGKTWLAYTQQPAHIDREKWERCTVCGSNVFVRFSAWKSGEDTENAPYMEGGARFCPSCGRPRLPQAWAELERRVFGEV